MACDRVLKRSHNQDRLESRMQGNPVARPVWVLGPGFSVEEYLPMLQELLLCFLTSCDLDVTGVAVFTTCFGVPVSLLPYLFLSEFACLAIDVFLLQRGNAKE